MSSEVKLFTPFRLREIEFRNRIFVSPMCQYSSQDGVPTSWHMVHLGSRAVGGAGLVMVEATGVSPVGRISPGDSGIWSEAQVKGFQPITEFIKSQGAVAGIQIAHAGRKGSTARPWQGGAVVAVKDGGWIPLAPSAEAFAPNYPMPREMNHDDIKAVKDEFAQAARNSLAAGFQVAEIHGAHGYLLHEFLSPLVNFRKDEYGGSLENRMRFPLQVAQTIREIWPAKWPVIMRISASDWADGGWNLEQSIVFSKELKKIGIDLVDCSSGGAIAHAKISVSPGYQVPFAQAIRQQAQIPTGAVGLITEPHQAEKILVEGQADVVSLAREMLRDPYWPLHAAKTLGLKGPWPVQYDRAAN